jgi:DNA polymerase
MLVAPEGRDFICSDFSAVEGRGLAYLAGEETELEAYRSGKDIYKVNASLIYSIPYEQVDGGGKGAQRQVGKTATLACGYSGGYSALCRFGFDKMPLLEADAYQAIAVMEETMREDNITSFTRMINPMSTDYEKTVISAYEDPATKEMAESFIKEVRGTWIVKQWRKNHPKTTQLWNDMKMGSIQAVQYKNATVSVCDGVEFYFKDRFLTMRLPSGRRLFYLDPRIEDVPTSWGSTQRVVTSMSVNSVTKQLERRQLNVSILVENLVQAFCRDLLKESMLRLDAHGYDIVAHIHDEILSEVDEGFGSVEEYEALMSQVPEWAKGMPLQAAGGYRSKRYRK